MVAKLYDRRSLPVLFQKLLATGVLTAVSSIAFAQTTEATESARKKIESFESLQSKVKTPSYVSLTADGRQIAWTLTETIPGEQTRRSRVYAAPLSDLQKVHQLLPSTSGLTCNSQNAAWSPDSHTIAYFSDCATPNQLQVFVADASNTQAPRQLTHLNGYVSHLQWSPDGKSIAWLYVESASRAPTPMAAENRAVGVIDDRVNRDVQRLAVMDVRSGEIRQMTPPDLYIFEYDWSPDGKSFAYTAAPPPGDDNWYIAQLYTQAMATAQPVSIFHSKLQIALPRWSPDGQSIAFIEGLMSDEGATGGEVYHISAHGGEARDLTPGRPSSPAWFTWLSNRELLFTEYSGGSIVMNTLAVSDGVAKEIWRTEETIFAGPEAASVSIAHQGIKWNAAFIRTSWSTLPEIWSGPMDSLHQLTQSNAGVNLTLPKAKSISWKSRQFPVQGWLLFPTDFDPAKKYPLLVAVHGGPAWIAQPYWRAPDFNTTIFTSLGYFVFYPNARGSFGQGEAFTQANRRDWGFGDLDDMVAGVDRVVEDYPVDGNRVGILGWSYGGSTAMMAVTRTQRFRAAVAGAGAGDWQSYYGQNSIDKWMIPYFGASVYDDPAAYLRVSAISHVREAKTPTLFLVGELDGEAPPAQSIEMWHALKELNVPTQLVIYADEGHAFFKQADRVDVTLRALQWFEKYLGQP
jgi:dipeptidyl aminopeptidase/acylaminoacyl peptidase